MCSSERGVRRDGATHRRALALVTLLTSLATGASASGTLVIAGGAVAPDNEAIFSAFADGLLPEGPVLVIPAASGRPVGSGNDVVDSLVRFGVARDRIRVYPLALVDDKGTESVDESEWRENAWRDQHVAQARGAAGVWFTGGDQMRIVRALRNESGEESPLLTVIRKQLDSGAVIGGTSAGAAVMSERMITGGDSFSTLIDPRPDTYEAIEEQESGRLSMTAGLGFLGTGLVDQHFDRKARLGRLVRALALAEVAMGYGVDEDTALVVDTGTGEAGVVGTGGVTVLDTGAAGFDWTGNDLARGIRLSLFPAGSSFNLETGKPVAVNGAATVGNEYYGHKVRAGGGMAFANQGLGQLLGNDLVDNDAASVVQRWSMDESGDAIVYSFSQTPQSRGYWESGSGYTVIGINFGIERQKFKVLSR